MGSTGEVSMLTPEERRGIVEKTVAMKDGRMKFFYGCTGPSTDATIGYLRHAKAAGADGAILAAPAYICAPEDDIEAYFAECADAVELPLGIYNNPPRVKSDLHWDHLLRIFRHPNYVIHKESTARVGQVAQLHALEKLHRHVGDVAGLAHVVDRDHVGVVEPAGGARLLVEARLVALDAVLLERHADRLYRYRSLQDGVGCLVDDAHGAAPDLGLDGVPAELRRLHAS